MTRLTRGQIAYQRVQAMLKADGLYKAEIEWLTREGKYHLTTVYSDYDLRDQISDFRLNGYTVLNSRVIYDHT